MQCACVKEPRAPRERPAEPAGALGTLLFDTQGAFCVDGLWFPEDPATFLTPGHVVVRAEGGGPSRCDSDGPIGQASTCQVGPDAHVWGAHLPSWGGVKTPGVSQGVDTKEPSALRLCPEDF